MGALELELKKVENLKINFRGELVHDDGAFISNRAWGDRDSGGYASWGESWHDSNHFSSPNPNTKEAARADLQQIYDSSEWYSARCAAAEALDKIVPKETFKEWLSELEKKFDSTSERGESETMEVGMENVNYNQGVYTPVYGAVSHTYDVPDEVTRHQAVMDSGELYRLTKSAEVRELLKHNFNFNDSESIRKEAGRALGHSNLRILVNEHPLTTALVGFAALTFTSSLIYTLLEYFGK